MFNSTGCPNDIARDDLLIPSGVAIEPECYLVVPLYYFLVIVYSLILLFVALIRTRLVQQRKYAKSQKSSNPHANSRGWKQISPFVLMMLSWCSFVVMVLLFIIPPAAAGRLNNSVIVLLGLQFAFFDIISERWLMKMIRLGARIIGPENKKTIGSNGVSNSNPGDSQDNERTRALDILKHSDNVLKILHVIVVVGIAFQFLCMCILSPAYPDQPVWRNIGIGMQGFNVFCLMSGLIWQYQRCGVVINASNKIVQNIVGEQQHPARSMTSVSVKFRRHQIILFLFGFPASIVFILWGFNALKVSYAVVLASGFFDAFVNCSVLVTFIIRATRGTRKPSMAASVLSGTTGVGRELSVYQTTGTYNQTTQ